MSHSVLLRHEARRNDENVGIVVLARELGDLRIPGDRGAHVRMPIRRVAHAEPRSAQQDAALHLPVRYLAAASGCA